MSQALPVALKVSPAVKDTSRPLVLIEEQHSQVAAGRVRTDPGMANGLIRMNYLAVGVPGACDQLRQGRGPGVQTSYWLAFERVRMVTDILIGVLVMHL